MINVFSFTLFLIFYHGFMIYIILIFSFFLNFLKIMTNAYLSKHFNFISAYDGILVISVIINVCAVMHPNTLK